MQEIKVWTDSANAHFYGGQIEAFCSTGHRFGRDATLLMVKMGNLRAWKWCVVCLRDPEDIRRQLLQAQDELEASFDIDAAMQKLRKQYQNISGEEMPDEGGR